MLRFLPVLSALALGACAAAAPGYIPPPLEGKKQSPIASALAKPMVSGDVGSDGRYVPSEDEKKLDCRKLTGSIQVMIDRLRVSGQRHEPSLASKAMQSATAGLSKGSMAGNNIGGETARERARLTAYNALLASKNCKTVNIEAELAKPRS
jgi:hypothetical protein